MSEEKEERTLKNITDEYNHHAAHAGHKSLIVREFNKEIEVHHEAMKKLDDEAKKLKEKEESTCPA